jgi:acetylornithine/succinyldiaminopimelate/putrescine aminotransferase
MRGEPRPGFVAAQGSFHGRSLATLALTGQPSYREGYEPLLPDVTLVPFGNAEALAQAVSDTTAAVFLEPIQGNSGVRIPPTGYLRTVRQICDRTGALLVLDEIQTGFGRTGRWFAHEHEGVVPDIMTLAKAMGGSLPLGAMVSTNEISAAMTPGSHGTTYGGNPVACAAGLATLKIIERDELVQRSEEKGAQLLELVKALEGQTEVRGRGLMVGFDIAGDANAVRARCRELGLLVAGGGKHTIRLLPPLLVESEQLDEACAILQQALNDTAAIDATGA